MMLRTLLLAGCALAARVAPAAEVRATSNTLLSASEEPRAGDAVASYPLYELVSFYVDGLDGGPLGALRIVGSGWGRVQLGDDEWKDSSGDVQLMFVESERRGLKLRLGRQHVTQGAGRMALLDGVNGEVSLPLGVHAQAFFGATPHRELTWDRGDWQTGGRIAKRLGVPGEIGVSYLQSRFNGDIGREELAADGFYRVGRARLLALAALSPATWALMEARLAVSYEVVDDLLVTLDGERAAPYLFIPRTSIFAAFAESKHDAFGGDLAWAPSPYYEVNLEGHALRLDDEWLGYRATLKATTFRDPSHRSLVGAEVRRVDEEKRAYVRGRVLTGLQILPSARLTADVFAYYFDNAINDQERSLLGMLSVVYDLAPSMRLVGSLSGGSSPYAESEVRGLVRFAYGYDTDLAREWVP